MTLDFAAQPTDHEQQPTARSPNLPAVALPVAGGAIRGIGEKFTANPVTGTASMSVPIMTSPGRAGFGPSLSLSYDSANGNGPFGFGWALSLPSITRKTDKGLPRYDDERESDVFLLSGAEDLVPVPGGSVVAGYRVDRYRPRTEGLFARIERWCRDSDGDTHWRVTTGDNITTWYGVDGASRIADPNDARKVFSWLICRSYDDKGNVVVYDYAGEDDANVDLAAAHEQHRDSLARQANRHLKRIRYGNRTSYLTDPGLADPQWMFEVVFDYGEHTENNPNPIIEWLCREDPFSTYRSGFEVRSYRLCRRVLMFHHFPGEPQIGLDCLVSATEFGFRTGDATGTFLTSVIMRGWRGDVSRALPPLEFDYTPAVLNDIVGQTDGIGRTGHWIDLDGEGISGLLTEHATGWFYRANLGAGRLARAREVSPVPASTARTQLLDLAGDGKVDVVTLEGPTPGFYERSDAGWDSFVPFQSLPTLDWSDPGVRFVDLSGDGLADVLITENDAFVWYPSQAERGFGAPVRKAMTAEPDETLQLADMTGDGLSDLVRIRNGEVCYWPNLGYGRFGAKVTMDQAPWLTLTEAFDPNRLRLADVDGSGVADLIYLSGSQTLVFLNRNGNSFTGPHTLPAIPRTAKATDLFGTGTACLVWESEQPGDTRLRYLDLMDGVKPHLLSRIVNNIGGERRLSYASSTHFYLADKAAGRRWQTRLPFPVQVLSQVEQLDRVAGSRFVTRYAYHDGCFDGVEREFRGFGQVDQWDTDEVPSAQGMDQMPPIWTKVWFHTGLDRGNAVLPGGLSAEEEREALRTLRGAPLRQEVYALDGSPKEPLPFHVVEHRLGVRRLHPHVYLPHPCETIARQHERTLYEVNGEQVPDPRVSQELVLDIDDWGNVLRSASIAYGRLHPEAGVDPRLPGWAAQALAKDQTQRHLTVAVGEYTNAVDGPSSYRAPARYQSKLFELKTSQPAAGSLLTADELRAMDTEPNRGLLKHDVTRYRADDLSGPLGPGLQESRGLPYESYTLALTPAMQVQLFDREGVDLAPDSLLAEAGYAAREGGWWVRSGQSIVSADHFYQPVVFIDPFGATFSTTHDPYDLLPAETVDPMGNRTVAAIDYRVLQPWQLTDANGNRSMVAFDALGMVVGSVVAGKTTENLGDTLAGFEPDLTEQEIAQYLADPKATGADLLGGATSRVVYDLWAFYRTRDEAAPAPVCTAMVSRDTHQSELAGGLVSGVRHTIGYSDGLGREIQRKDQAEQGLWVATGWVVLNNKGLPVRKYEPFFAAVHHYEADAVAGVSAVICYDPSGLVIATLYPDGSYDKGIATPWSRTIWDSNDTVLLDPRTDEDVLAVAASALDNLPPQFQTWHGRRVSGVMGAAAKEAALAAAAHAATPAVTYSDPLGRTVLTVAHHRTTDGTDELHATHALLDVEGNQLELTDPAGRAALRSAHDLMGRAARETGADTGETIELCDVSGVPVLVCDARGIHVRTKFDALRRPVEMWVDGKLVERTVWGETHPQAAAFNLRTRAFKVFDEAGLASTLECDFKGNVVHSARRLVTQWQGMPDWATSPALADEFESRSAFDARSRPTLSTAPDGSQVRHTYNEAGLLERLDVRLVSQNGTISPQWTPIVTGIAYTARAERERVEYGNGSHTENEYDPLTFRLSRQTTVAGNATVQDVRFTYDAHGNLTQTRDDAQQAVFFAGSVVEPSRSLRYDPLYRLIEASGREHVGQQSEPAPDWRDTARSGLPHPHDAQAMRRYTQSFGYDNCGNLRSVTHAAGGSGWTRSYHYADPLSNRLAHTQIGPGPAQPYTYDAAGDMLSMPHLQQLTWDHRRRLVKVDRGGGGIAHYQYSDAGDRVRKVLTRFNGSRAAERIYLGGFELYREYNGSGETATLARTTLHIMDVALVESRTLGVDMSPQRVVRYQLSEHLSGSALELDAAADVLTYEEYYPYGAAAFASHRGSSAPPAKRYRYAGKERDEETGLSYHGARFCALWLARWISADPAGVRPGELTGYVYCANRPTTLTDPDGQNPTPQTNVPVPKGPGWRPGMNLDLRPPSPPSSRPPVVTRTIPRAAPRNIPRRLPGTAPSAGFGRWMGRATAVGLFLEIMLTPSNDAEYPHYNEYVDPDTGETLAFKTYEDRDSYVADRKRQQEEERKAPGPDDKGPVEAPSPGPDKGPVHAPGPDPSPSPKQAPGPTGEPDKKEAPGPTEPTESIEAMPGDRPLTDKEKAGVLGSLKAGRSLSPDQKALLRGEARWMWKNQTGGKGKQPGKTHQVHHLIPLEFAHLFPTMYPNLPKNLYLMETQSHSDLHWIMNKWLRENVGKVTAEILEGVRKEIIKNWPGKFMWEK